ncbi:EcoRII like protein [Pseudomonas savastanoi]|uniref:EcoRII like protein n=1 Tax=Pseudomonas savastanoi TaxID=29438 RepID=A0A3M5ZU41_PSESS|nr:MULTISPECIES: type II restriction endonuclease [Pseudomonas syringae group]RMR06519.1 EcoRII like protein [Pseudomonas syringae pv. helianthi]RMV10537.1 EcoRII like protein [Pseudomonas savastanoi]
MFNDSISDYFEGVAAKYLSAVDADPIRSNQHEIGGLPSAGFQQHLGAPGKYQEYKFHAKQIYVTDDSIAPEIVEATVTWYDCRRKQPHRRPEYRLYYSKTAVSELICEGDFLLVAKMLDGSLLMIFSPAGSTTESQLRLLFGLSDLGDSFKAGLVKNIKLHLPVRLILEGLGIETKTSERDDATWLERLVALFGGDEFPTTSAFSKFALDTVEDLVDPLIDPDQAILGWMEHEEKLFRIYERHLVQKRLSSGFGQDGSDVDGFISFSLSVQNRRKSRVGHAFEGYLKEVFNLHGLHFSRGGRKGCFTENNSKPDFIFPSFEAYNNKGFPAEKLYMLGAKTTCKDRWRQVLSEADRIKNKHLFTIEAAISEAQTSEMRSNGLQLVVPRSLHLTYSSAQSSWLIDFIEFIDLIKWSQA